MRVPGSTYRVQFNSDFRFNDARALLPYLETLGITDLYASPIWQARGGSVHGYDVTNPARLSPDLGTEEEFLALADELRTRGMGLLSDIVPNHMAASPENPWWTDVLENGPSSPYAAYFGVRWESVANSDDRIYLPILGDPYGTVLESGNLQIKIAEDGLSLNYYSHHLPLDPSTYPTALECPSAPEVAEWQDLLAAFHRLPARTATDWDLNEQRLRERDLLKQRLWQLYTSNEEVHAYLDARLRSLNGTAGEPHSFDELDRLLQEQPYRLAFWKVAREKINYRRFFDVSDLISLRAEDPQVFAATHAYPLRLIAEGRITGLRIDHVDGLFHPRQYLELLQERSGAKPFYVVVEKITLGEETLPREWPVAGTTGYDFMAAVNGLYTDTAGLSVLDRYYGTLTGAGETFTDVQYRNKKRVIEDLFRGEVLDLAQELCRLAEQDRHARDLNPSAIGQALEEITACLPVYRTYTESFDINPRDAAYLDKAITEAARRQPTLGEPVFAFVRRVMTLECPPLLTEAQRGDWLRWVMRWQQLSGPIMAKGVEDTSFYQYNRLISLNEVGGDLQTYSLENFHQFQQQRQAEWPHTLNATSTHDTKRSEDVRARIAVLSELAPEWERLVRRWMRWNQAQKPSVDGRPVPDANEEYLLYQTLLGAWPFQPDEEASFLDRLQEFLQKATREAKLHSSWLNPCTEYEQAFQQFSRSILQPNADNRFRKQFLDFAQRIAFFGAMNSLSQLVLKIGCPGVPDFYQGSVYWDLSLVDPDNRRPVDFPQRMEFLEVVKRQDPDNLLPFVRTVVQNWPDGGAKLFLAYQCLNFRRSHPNLFSFGEYLPLTLEGNRRENLVAFARRHETEWAVVLAPRFYTNLTVLLRPPAGRRIWHDDTLALPENAPARWRNVITGEEFDSASSRLPVADALKEFPVALLTGVSA